MEAACADEVCTNLDNAAVSVIEGSAMYITATEIVQLKRKFCEKTRWTEPAVYGDMGHAVDNPKKPHTAWFPPQKPAKFGVNKDVCPHYNRASLKHILEEFFNVNH